VDLLNDLKSTRMIGHKFEVGDCGPHWCSPERKMPKLVMTWQGQYRAVRFENEQVLEVENLLNGKTKCVYRLYF
jgi:hypothetical protein